MRKCTDTPLRLLKPKTHTGRNQSWTTENQGTKDGEPMGTDTLVQEGHGREGMRDKKLPEPSLTDTDQQKATENANQGQEVKRKTER